MIECSDCGSGFTPENFKQTICDDCFEQRQLWEEMDEERKTDFPNCSLCQDRGKVWDSEHECFEHCWKCVKKQD